MRRHSPDDGNGLPPGCNTAIGALVALLLILACIALVWLLPDPCDGATLTYARATYAWQLRAPATPAWLARQQAPNREPLSLYLVAWEIATVNGLQDPGLTLTTGSTVKLPIYRPASIRCGDLRNWHCAVMAGHQYGVAPELLLAIRAHENPSPSADYKALGCKCWCGHCRGWQHGGMRGQYLSGAKTVRRIARGDTKHKQWDWDPQDPTESNVYALGRAYANGSNTWGSPVWALYRRAMD